MFEARILVADIILSVKDSQSIIYLNEGLKQWLKHSNQARMISLCDEDPQTSKPKYIADSRDTNSELRLKIKTKKQNVI